MSLSFQVSENRSNEWYKNQAVCFQFDSKSVVVKSLQNFSTPGIYCIMNTLPVSTPIQMTATGFSDQGNAFLWAYIAKHKTRLTTNYTLLPLNTSGSVTTTFTIPSWASGSSVYAGVLFTAPYIGDEFTLSSLTFSGGGGGGDDSSSDDDCSSDEGASSQPLSINNNIYLDKVLEFSKKYQCCVPDYDENTEQNDCDDELPCYVFDECNDLNKDCNFVPCKLKTNCNPVPCNPVPCTDSLQKDLESLIKLQESMSNALQKASLHNTCPVPVPVPTKVQLSNFDTFLSSLL